MEEAVKSSVIVTPPETEAPPIVREFTSVAVPIETNSVVLMSKSSVADESFTIEFTESRREVEFPPFKVTIPPSVIESTAKVPVELFVRVPSEGTTRFLKETDLSPAFSSFFAEASVIVPPVHVDFADRKSVV